MISAAFHAQAHACAKLGSPLTARVLAVLAETLAPGTPLTDRLFSWPGDIGGSGASLPLRLAGGLHALQRLGRDDALAALYANADRLSDAALAAGLLAALERHDDFLMGWIDSAPQTNEVRRSAVLIAAAHLLTARHDLPLVLSELGASAGLNLLWDHYALRIGDALHGPPDAALVLTPDWSGPQPPHAAPRVAERAGVDLNPLDPVADRLRLLSYIWADQTDRLGRTEAALDLAARLRPPVARGDAADWLATRLATARPGHLHLICHTIAWQYFPPQTQARCHDLLVAAGRRATPEAPLAHLAMEADGGPEGAALTLRLWPGGTEHDLGRADFHGRWLRWRIAALPG